MSANFVAVGGTSSGKNTDFLSITAVFTSVASVWLLDFALFSTLIRHCGLRRFLFVGPEICYRFFQLSDYFDHASETPGLGGKIKDDPSFRAAFAGKTLNMAGSKHFEIVKGGAPAGQTNAIDAISGATMTSKGLEAAINNWLGAYKNYIQNAEEK